MQPATLFAMQAAAIAATKFAATEARAHVRTIVVALRAGSVDLARAQLDHYLRRVDFVGSPSEDVQRALRAELAAAYAAMTPAQKSDFDALFDDLTRAHPRAWLSRHRAR